MFHRLVLVVAASAVFGMSAELSAQERPAVPSSDMALHAIAFELQPGSSMRLPFEADSPGSQPAALDAAAGDEPAPGTQQRTAIEDQEREAVAMAAARSVAKPGGEKAPPGPAAYPEPQTFSDRYAPEKTGWTRDLVALEIGFQVANALDAVATERCLQRATCKEVNPLLGKRPSAGVIYGVKAAAGLVHYFAIDMLASSSTATARTIAWITTVVQTGIVGINLTRTF
jgi:hypothetical protein